MLDTAAAVVRERGFANTRLADIGERLQMTAASLVYHFGTKEELLAQTLGMEATAELDRLRATVAGPDSAQTKMRRLVTLSISRSTTPDWRLWVDAWGEGMRTQTMRNHLSDLDNQWRAALATVIRSGQADRTWPAGDAAVLAAAVMSLLDGIGVQLAVHPTNRATSKLMHAAPNLIEAMLSTGLALSKTSAPKQRRILPSQDAAIIALHPNDDDFDQLAQFAAPLAVDGE